jgi:hypothetical protein
MAEAHQQEARLMTTHEVRIEEKSVPEEGAEPKLAASLVLPGKKGPYPAILFVHGSGPVDRDENTKGPLKLNVFNQLADYFALVGWASLRYDRGVLAKVAESSKEPDGRICCPMSIVPWPS